MVLNLCYQLLPVVIFSVWVGPPVGVTGSGTESVLPVLEMEAERLH